MTPPAHESNAAGIVLSGNVTYASFLTAVFTNMVGGVMTPPYAYALQFIIYHFFQNRK